MGRERNLDAPFVGRTHHVCRNFLLFITLFEN